MKRTTLVIILLAMFVVSCLALTACHTCEFGEWAVATPATCTEIGQEKRVCSCGKFEVRDIPATGHSYQAVVTTPTCTEQGYTTHTCTCGDSYVDTYVDAAGHSYAAVVTAPTCTEQGYTTHICACGDSYVDTYTDETGHSYVDVVTAPTCTEQGYTTHTCSICEDSFVDAYVDALGHTEGEVVVENNIAPKCTVDGSYDNVVYCTVCDAELSRQTVTVDAPGHDEIPHDAQAVTCTEIGWDAYVTCSRCDHTTYVEIPVTGHTDGEWITDIEPTCTTEGSKHQVCATCGETIDTSVIQSVGQHSLTTSLSDKLCVACLYCDYSDEYDLAIDTNKLYGLNQFKQNANEDFYNFYIDLYNAATIFANSRDDLVEENNEYVIAKIDTQSYSLSDLELMSVWKIFYMENPQFYWLTNTVDFCENGFLLLADEAYSKYEDRARYDLLISDMLADASKSIAFAKNELEVVFNLHDFILSNNEYAYIEGTSTPETEIWAHNLVGFAEKNKGVCEAYAKTFLYFSYIFDIDNIIVTGQSFGENHGWNLVEIDGNWYYFDFTWDDRESEGIAYNYFGLSAETMQKDHTNDTSSNEGFNYLYNLPDALADIELVKLYQDGVDIGLRTSIDNAIDSMTDADSEYEIELFRYDYVSQGGVATIVDKVHHISKDIPAVKHVTITGQKQNMGNNGFVGSFVVSYVYLSEHISLHSNLTLINISILSDIVFVLDEIQRPYTLNLQDQQLILNGYYNSIDAKIFGSDSAWLIADTEQPSSIWTIAIGNVSIEEGRECDFGGVVEISNLYLSTFSRFNISSWVQDAIIENIHNVLGSSMTIRSYNGDANVSIGNVESDLYIRVIFDDVAHYPNISFVGELNGDITLNLDGNLTLISIDLFTGEVQLEYISVNPMRLIGTKLFVANEENFDKVKLIFNNNYVDHSDLCVMNYDGEVYFDLPEADQDGFIIKDNVLIGYVGNGPTVVIPEGVTSIGAEAFSGIKTIYQVVLPSTLTHIGDVAFSGCTKLVEVVNHSQLDIQCGTMDFGFVARYAFSVTKEAGEFTVIQDKFLFYLGEVNYLISYFGTDETVILPQTDFEYHINRYAFYQNTTMKHVDLGKKAVSIGENAFELCEFLEEVYIPANIKQIGERAFYSCTLLNKVTFDPNSSLTSIASGMFMACPNLTTVTLPNSVTNICSDAFSDCTRLTNITLSSSLTTIGNSAFAGCKSLESIRIPSSVTSIGDCVFENCDSLTSIIVDKDSPSYQTIDGHLYSKDGKTLVQYAIGKTEESFEIPKAVTHIGNYAFYGCSNLKSVTMPDGVTSIGNHAFQGCTGLTSIIIPEGVTSIGYYAFYGCSNLKSVTMPDGVTSIGICAFQGCISLTDIAIPNGLTCIYAWTFDGCTSLTSIILPDGIEYIDGYAFAGCSNLKSVTIPDSVTSIGSFVFNNCTSLTNVYYTGTEKQWNSIWISSDNEFLTNVTIHFNSTGE